MKATVKVQNRNGVRTTIMDGKEAIGDSVFAPELADYIERRLRDDETLGTEVESVMIYVRTK